MLKIKICGITNLEDAENAAALGVDALGFIFAKSPRQVEPTLIKEICHSLPPFITRVGVFVDEELDKVNSIAETCGLDAIQLHGQESSEYCQHVHRRVIKALRVKKDTSLKILEHYKDIVCAFLLDAYDPEKPGGTGNTFDWGLAAKAQKAYKTPIILSGGLNAENIQEALKTLRPDAVDINSGVESAPGKKDYNKMQEIIKIIRNLK
ncbi:MAG: phosphoribosylanthranilate isomerase [Candidatus Margulisbacteria bacterium]|nr:phosphoribosylanthranilate isomerase [Candidatus Margulisiibacteriota bacterium]